MKEALLRIKQVFELIKIPNDAKEVDKIINYFEQLEQTQNELIEVLIFCGVELNKVYICLKEDCEKCKCECDKNQKIKYTKLKKILSELKDDK